MGKNYVLSEDEKMRETPGGWEFDMKGTGFTATFEIQLDHVPEDGTPFPLRQYLASVTPATAGSEKSAMPRPAGETGPPGA
jgi:hypothetical protein